MKALVKYALGESSVELRDVAEPVPVEGEVKVKVLAVGICGSDIHAIEDKRREGLNMPVILGHEFVGQVCETCGDTGDVKVGDWITALPACYSCGECEMCKKGLVTLCRERKSIGTHRDGAMANYVVVPAKYCFKLPESAKTLQDKKLYAMAEPFGCVVRGVYERIDVKKGDVAVVSGPGPMGLMAVQLFKARGAYVIMSGLPVDEEKLALAKTLGADETVTSLEALKEAVYRNNPYGADITCECAGVLPSFKNCLEVIRSSGVHLQIATYGDPIPTDMDLMLVKEITFVPTNSTAFSTWKIAVELMANGSVDLKPLMNLELPLEKWREGIDATISRRKYKVVLLPDNTFDE